jgi:hypothetical protein
MTLVKLRIYGWYKGRWYWFSVGLLGVTLSLTDRGWNYHNEWAQP